MESYGKNAGDLSFAEYETLIDKVKRSKRPVASGKDDGDGADGADGMIRKDEADFQELLQEARLQATADEKQGKGKKKNKKKKQRKTSKGDKMMANQLAHFFKSANGNVNEKDVLKEANLDENSLGEMLHEAVKLMAQQNQQHNTVQDKRKAEAIARQAQKLRVEEAYNAQEDTPKKPNARQP